MDRIDYTIHEATQRNQPVGRHVAIGALPFAGRDVEMAGLVAAYRDAYSGARTVAVISGEMGSGKTRLLDEFCQRPELQRSFIVRLRLYGDDCHKDLNILREALLDALESRPTLRRHIESVLDSGALTRDREIPLARVLDLLARRVPLVLAIDNLDNGGDECCRELEATLCEIDHSLLVVATTTPVNVGRVVNFSRAIEAETIEVRLCSLGREAFAQHITELFAIEPTTEDLDWMVEVTRGLPVLLREALNALLRTGSLVRRNDGWYQAHPFARSRFTPLDALPLLKWRLAQLDESDRRTLATIALLGNRVPRPLLTEVGVALESCAALTSHDFLNITGRYVEFAHRLLFDAAFAEAQALGLCEAMHGQLMSALLSGGDRGTRLPQLTIRTLLEQADNERRLMLLDTLLKGAGAFANDGEYLPADTYFSECRRWWPEIVARYGAAAVANWTIDYSYVLYNLGRTDEQQKLLHDFLADIDAATLSSDIAFQAAQALIALIEACSRAKKIQEAMELVEQASAMIQLAPPSEATRDLELRIELRRGQVLEAADRDAEAATIYRDILERWDALSFSPSVFEAIIWLQNLVRGDEETEQLHRYIEQMLDVCEDEGRMRQGVQLRSILAMHLFTAGEYEQAESAMRTLITEARRYSLPRTESSAWSILAKIYAMRGNFSEALRLIERTIEIRWRVRSLAFWQLAVITKAQFLVSAGRDNEALAVLDTLEKDATSNDRPYRRFIVEVCRSRMAVRRGGSAQERKRLAELRAIGEEEEFDGVEQMMLELEGEVLLHLPKVSASEARSYSQRVLRHTPEDMSARMLYIMAAAVTGRATPANSASRRAMPKDVEGTLAKGIETLQEWKEEGAFHNMAAGIELLRLHASHLLNDTSLALPDTDALAVDGEPRYRYDIRAFGRLRILDDCGAEQGGRHFGTQKSDSKPRKMLAALVVAAVDGQGLSRERLVDMIWGEGTTSDSAANNFHVTLSGLRQVVGDAIDFDGARYALDTAKLRIDVLEFLMLVEKGTQADRQGRTFHAYDLLREACDLYSGEFLEGIYDEWSDRARDVLRGKGRNARLRLAEIALQRGEPDVAHTTVHALLTVDTTDEAAMQLRLTAFQAEGHRMLALREYEKFAALLAAEYGVTPSRPLRELRDDIARQ